MDKEEIKEQKLKAEYFRAKDALYHHLSDKYWKYHNMPVVLKKNVYKNEKERIGFYLRHDMPTFMNHARLHHVQFNTKTAWLCEDEFEIYKKPIHDQKGVLCWHVDVKCPDCKGRTIVDMKYLLWKFNCKHCRSCITVENVINQPKKKVKEWSLRY